MRAEGDVPDVAAGAPSGPAPAPPPRRSPRPALRSRGAAGAAGVRLAHLVRRASPRWQGDAACLRALATAADAFGVAARAGRLPPEAMLVRLKLHVVPELTGLAPDVAAALLSHVVTLAIRAFFAEANAAEEAPNGVSGGPPPSSAAAQER